MDLVLHHRDGRYFAVQCKFKFSQSTSLSWTKDRLTSWLSEADECDGLILFTNASDVDAHTRQKSRKKDFRLYTLADLVALSSAMLREILRAARGERPRTLPRAKPRRFQAEAVREVANGFKKHARGQHIHPCGAGKTLTSLWIRERLKAKRTLVLVPSLALLRQTKKEWSTHQKEWFPYLCVCSEKGIDRDVREDRAVARIQEIHGTVTTDANEIRCFARRHKRFIIYSTYQSLDAVIRALKPTKITFDLAICDEAHKTASDRKGEFAFIHDAKKIRAKRRLYMTATPKVTSTKIKDKLGDETFKLLADMSDPAVFGPVFHEMTFGEAIDQRILVDYKIVIIGVGDQELKKAISRRAYTKDTTIDEVANNLALDKIMAKYRADHAITFHSSIRRAKAFHERHREYHPRVWTEHVNGTMSTNDREILLREFREEPKGVLTNARCLTEGIHVPAIDCVYFCDPKSSKIDIVQASGRALRKPQDKRKKDFGFVVVPVFHRNRKNVKQAIDRSVFRHIVNVVRALADQDERIQAEIHALVAGKGRRRSQKQRIQVDLGGERITLVGFEKALKQSLFDQIVEKSTTIWDARITELLAYAAEHGHMRVPKEAPVPWTELGLWVDRVRAKYRLKEGAYHRLSEARIQELNSLGFDWKVDGQTLDDTTGLLNESQIRKETGLNAIAEYREQGLIKPVGYAQSATKLSAFYHRSQIDELKRKLGITLKSTKVLLNEYEFEKASGLTNIVEYRKNGLIKPIGYAITHGGRSAFYHRSQIADLKKRLGITLKSTKGLLSEKQFIKASGFTQIRKYRKRGLINPVGRAMSASRVSFFYRRSQIKPLRKKLGITLANTTGLLSELQFAKALGVSYKTISRYRKKGLIEPVGHGMTNAGLSPFYRRSQIKELQTALGLTLKKTTGLLNEAELKQASGLTRIAHYRKRGLLEPAGYGLTISGLGWFYHRSQIKKLKKKLGITLDSTKGLLCEEEFARLCGLSTPTVVYKRKHGLIVPVGYAMSATHLSAFYRRSQIKQLKQKLTKRRKR